MKPNIAARKFQASIVVSSDTCTSVQLTQLLDLSPDVSWEEGETFFFYGKERRRRANLWSVRESDGDIEDWRTTVDRLLARVRPVADRFRALPEATYVALQLFITENNAVFGVRLDRRHIEFMSSIRAELDMSVVVYGQDHATREG